MHIQTGNENKEPIEKGARIGLFDSGLGGLSVLRQLSGRLGSNAHSFVYLGDSARCPYGDRSASEISLFVTQIFDWLTEQTVDSIVIACNTSAAVISDEARRAAKAPVIDLIDTTARYVAKNYDRIGVMGTTTTIKRKAFSKAIHEQSAQKHVVEIACPDLVPLIERGAGDSAECEAVLKKYCDKLLKEEVQSVILGCTHFPFVHAALTRILRDRVQLIDPAILLADAIAKQVCGESDSSDSSFVSHANTKISRSHIYTTGDPNKFRDAAKVCLGYSLDTVNGLTVDELTMTSPAISLVEHAVGLGAVTPNMVPAT